MDLADPRTSRCVLPADPAARQTVLADGVSVQMVMSTKVDGVQLKGWSGTDGILQKLLHRQWKVLDIPASC